MDDLIEYGQNNGFDVVRYDEFYKSLSEVDRKTAPPKSDRCPFFALFHPIRKRPMFVLKDLGAIKIPIFKEIVDDIIGHEKIHGIQNSRRAGLTFALPNPNQLKEYFSNSDEIMAFSWTIANGLSKNIKNIDSAIKELSNLGKPSLFRSSPHGSIWNEIINTCDQRVIQRYRKYIYQYLEKILGRSQENPIHTKINKRNDLSI